MREPTQNYRQREPTLVDAPLLYSVPSHSSNAGRFEIVCEDPESGEERVFGGTSPAESHNAVISAINAAPGMPPEILTAQ